MVSEELSQQEPEAFLGNWLGKWLGKQHFELSDSLPEIQSSLLTLQSRSHWHLHDTVKSPGQEEQWAAWTITASERGSTHSGI